MERVPLAEKFFSNIINPILDRLLLASRLSCVRAERTIRRRRRTLDGNEKSGVFERERRSSVATKRRILRKPNIKENVGKNTGKRKRRHLTARDERAASKGENRNAHCCRKRSSRGSNRSKNCGGRPTSRTLRRLGRRSSAIRRTARRRAFDRRRVSFRFVRRKRARRVGRGNRDLRA